MARQAADAGRAQSGRRATGERQGRREAQEEKGGRAWICIFFGLVVGEGVPSAHTGCFLPQDNQALKTKQNKKTQPKQNQKCRCGAPCDVLGLLFPRLTAGDNGPVYPGDPSPAPGSRPSSTPAVSDFFHLLRARTHPALAWSSRPGLFPEEVSALVGLLGLPQTTTSPPTSQLKPWEPWGPSYAALAHPHRMPASQLPRGLDSIDHSLASPAASSSPLAPSTLVLSS